MLYLHNKNIWSEIFKKLIMPLLMLNSDRLRLLKEVFYFIKL